MKGGPWARLRARPTSRRRAHAGPGAQDAGARPARGAAGPRRAVLHRDRPPRRAAPRDTQRNTLQPCLPQLVAEGKRPHVGAAGTKPCPSSPLPWGPADLGV